MRLYTLLLGLLGVWRVAYMLHAEDGPADVFLRVRRRLEAGAFAAIVGCFYCLTVWVAVPFAWLAASLVGASWLETFLLWPALSAGAIVIERLTSRDAVATVRYQEDRESIREDH